MVEHVSNLSDFQGIIRNSGNKLVVVDFTAVWCGPCKAIAPHYEGLARRYQGRARFLKVDVDEAQDIAQQSSVSSMPTFHFYRNGTRVAEFSGADPAKLDQTVEQHAPTTADVSFSGGGQRLGADSNGASGAPPASASSMREAAALAATRRLQQLADASNDDNNASPTAPDAAEDDRTKKPEQSSKEANDARLKVNQSLVKQMVDEMGFPRLRSEKALILTGNKSLEDAVEWCFEHADDADIDEPLQVVSGPSSSTDAGEGSKKPEGTQGPKLSKEEVKKRADELYTKARVKRETEEKREAIEREKQRMKSGKEIAIAKAKLEEQERHRAVEERRRQKREELADRERVRQKLLADKEARRRKFKMPNSSPEPQPQQAKSSPQPKPALAHAPASSGKIQFRLPDGSRVEGEFSAQQTMGDVVKFLATSRPELSAKPIQLSQQYPRKVFSPADYGASLSELNLLPRGALIVSFS